MKKKLIILDFDHTLFNTTRYGLVFSTDRMIMKEI